MIQREIEYSRVASLARNGFARLGGEFATRGSDQWLAISGQGVVPKPKTAAGRGLAGNRTGVGVGVEIYNMVGKTILLYYWDYLQLPQDLSRISMRRIFASSTFVLSG